ncbi:hypothetical protein HELRODRAFT_166429 [Helobdella robusta]|uniref:Uncharacterized protein n=1 Tax=Helobdella robusta TaxID=6412 RepID=T1EY46_HELRO|nr:hypothetical protein HELRODRAFT_166429 [Helobdella robusta]ESN90726.1 hypothetical protein HELRODRAFT_166429 [Helobdella robusta]
MSGINVMEIIRDERSNLKLINFVCSILIVTGGVLIALKLGVEGSSILVTVVTLLLLPYILLAMFAMISILSVLLLTCISLLLEFISHLMNYILGYPLYMFQVSERAY